ncbi:MAG: NDP-sugar synthase [Candidatus Bathyarchaeia archaeon]
MKALILAGGFATRLRPLSCTRPKILFPVLNKPIVEWIMERLSKNDIEEVIFAINNQTACHLKQVKIPNYGMKIAYSYDPPKKPLGTGGAIKRAEKFLSDSDFLVVNGDIFADIDYSKIIEMHMEKRAVATIALHKAKDPSRYGVAELAENGRVEFFVEKPLTWHSSSSLINAGIYVLNPKIFSYIPRGRKVSLEREIFPILVKERTLYGYPFEGLWTDIGKIDDYLEVNKVLLEMFHKKTEGTFKGGGKTAPPAVCGDDTFVGRESVVGPYAVLGRKVRVGTNVQIRNSVIFDGVSIGDSSVISGAVIGENAVIGKGVRINENCVIGDYAVIGDKVKLAKGVIVCPAKEIFEDITTPKCIF